MKNLDVIGYENLEDIKECIREYNKVFTLKKQR